jgi:hypothetical protein
VPSGVVMGLWAFRWGRLNIASDTPARCPTPVVRILIAGEGVEECGRRSSALVESGQRVERIHHLSQDGGLRPGRPAVAM